MVNGSKITGDRVSVRRSCEIAGIVVIPDFQYRYSTEYRQILRVEKKLDGHDTSFHLLINGIESGLQWSNLSRVLLDL